MIKFFDDGTMLVKVPYNKDFIEALNWNQIPRVFRYGDKAFRIDGKYAADVLKLVMDFYTEEDIL